MVHTGWCLLLLVVVLVVLLLLLLSHPGMQWQMHQCTQQQTLPQATPVRLQALQGPGCKILQLTQLISAQVLLHKKPCSKVLAACRAQRHQWE